MRYKAIKINGKKFDAHRVIAGATTLGRHIVVHHKNGNKLDNSLDNLSVMTGKEHLRIHGFGTLIRPSKLFVPSDRGTAICRNCKEEKPIQDFTTNKSWTYGITSMCKSCTRAYKKAWRNRKTGS